MSRIHSIVIGLVVIVSWSVKRSAPTHCGVSRSNNCYRFSKLEKQRAYSQPGDISIGVLLPMTDTGPDSECIESVHGIDWILQYTEAVKYATDQINQDPDLLPGTTLGFTILDTCSSENIAVAAALTFLQKPTSVSNNNEVSPSITTDNLETEIVSSMYTNSSSEISTGNDVAHNSTSCSTRANQVSSYDVIGILGPLTSDKTLPASLVYRVAQIPILSYMATSDELSNRILHKYFMRVVPPDKNQVQAMISFVHSMGWEYISVVYSRGSYGENGFDKIKLLAPKYGICIAKGHRITELTNFTEVMVDLMQYPRARVVIVFTGFSSMLGLYAAESMLNISGHFVWIGSDGVAERAGQFTEYKRQVHGTFSFVYFSKHVPEFAEYLRKLRRTKSKNPWLQAFWEKLGKCSFNDQSSPDSCGGNEDITNIDGFDIVSSVSLVIDCVYTYAYALHRLLTDHCPNATGVAPRQCVRGDLLLDYMMTSDFNGTTGRIRFDEEGSLRGKYKVMQYRVENYVPDLGSRDNKKSTENVPFEDSTSNIENTNTNNNIGSEQNITLDGERANTTVGERANTTGGERANTTGGERANTTGGERANTTGGEDGLVNIKGRLVETVVGIYDLDTDHFEYQESIVWNFVAEKQRVIPLGADEEKSPIPESVCSRPCTIGEYRVQVDPCCWECRRCRSNEYIGESTCVPCEEFTWPDPDTNYFSCAPIPLSHPKVSDTLPLLLIVLGLVAILCSLAVLAAYFYLREARVIKAASRELSFLQISAILIGYVTVLVFQAPPTHVTCSAQYFLFCFSFSLLYAPMLVKAVRIFRIFQSGKTHKRPRFVSPVSQVIKSMALVLVQIIVCIVVYTIWQPTAVKIQPLQLERFVELSCDMTLPGLSSFLCYNLVLVTLCSVLAFKTRTLPDNFNESRFTSMCVSTTLVIWLAFIPTYFTATRTVVRVLLLSVSLLLNHTVALVFLFIPKIYAAVYVPEDRFTTTRFQSNLGHRSRVGPVPDSDTRPSTVNQGPVF